MDAKKKWMWGKSTARLRSRKRVYRTSARQSPGRNALVNIPPTRRRIERSEGRGTSFPPTRHSRLSLRSSRATCYPQSHEPKDRIRLRVICVRERERAVGDRAHVASSPE